jgi:hypothetical protein
VLYQEEEEEYILNLHATSTEQVTDGKNHDDSHDVLVVSRSRRNSRNRRRSN